MKNKQIIGLILAIFLLSFVSATYNFTNYSIQDQYTIGSSISGNIQISFTNEPVNNVFTDSFGNSVSLKELIKSSTGYNYNCAYTDCESKFKESDSKTAFSFPLNDGKETFYGITFKDKLTKINSISFDLESDATESPTNQISIDLLNDGTVDFKNSEGTNTFQDANFGCYVSSNETEVSLTENPYCQEVSLEEAPGLKIGAWIKEITSGNLNVTMKLFDKKGGFVKSCVIPNIDINSAGSSEFCEVNVPIKKDNYYVCIIRSPLGSGEYKIHGHNQATNCGFIGAPVKTPIYTYQIGAKEKYFGSVGTIPIINSISGVGNFSKMVQDYITSNYGSLDCSKTSCIVPIKISSSKDQDITLKNLNVNYDFVGGLGVTLDEFSELTEDPSLVNSSKGTLFLGNFFNLSNEEKNSTYILTYDGNKLFEKDITIKDFKINLNPTKVPVLFSTELYVYVPSSLGASSYEWTFGDNSSTTTSTNTVRHAYSVEGNYSLNILVTTKIGKISKSFNVEVGSAKEILKSEIKERKDVLNGIEDSYLSLGAFEKSQIDGLFDLSSLKANLSSIETREASATLDSEYNSLITEFLSLKFPSSLQKVEISNSFINPSESGINLDALSSVTGLNYKDSTGTYDYVTFWNIANINSALSQNKVVINWEDGTSSSTNFYDLSILPVKPFEEESYLFMRNSGNLTFDDDSKIKEVEGYKYLSLTGSRQDLTFSADEGFNAGTDIFVSPSNVTVFEGEPIPELKVKTWIIYLGLGAVLLIGLLIYLILHRWYKVKYEKFLFPDKNQLYNAIVYITNLSKKGVSEDEIKVNLLKAGWKREQVSYLLKKYAGKRTGMVDLFGFLKPKKEIDMGVTPSPGRNVEFRSIDDTKFNK